MGAKLVQVTSLTIEFMVRMPSQTQKKLITRVGGTTLGDMM